MTKIRSVAYTAVLAALVCGSSAAVEVTVLAASGIVRVAPQGSEAFSQVVPGQVLAEGMVVVTGEDGRITISVGSRNTVRLRGNSKLVIRTVQPRMSRFQLLAGKLRGAFEGMTGRQRFELEFAGGSAVASVKGTVFTAEANDVEAILRTIYGDIDVTVDGKTNSVPQGCGIVMRLSAEGALGDGGRVRIEVLGEREINDGLDRPGGEAASRADRSDLYIFVNTAGSGNSKDREIVNQMREDDFAAGRSLRDVHGNLARVDQRLYRPDPSSIEFVNLVKRDSYNYGTGKFSYNGYSGSRYDYFQVTTKFNMPLPDSVMDWPNFVKDNADNIKPTQVVATFANGGPNDTTRDVIQKTVNFDAKGDPVVVGTTPHTYQVSEPYQYYDSGTHSTQTGYHTVTRTEQEKVEDETFLVNGVPYLVDGDADTRDVSGVDSGELWGTGVLTAYKDANGNKMLDAAEKTAANKLLLRAEGYAIDSNGAVLNLNTVMDEGVKNPLGYVQTIAAEAIVSPVDSQGRFVFGQGGVGTAAGTAAVKPSNIDLVVIPDIAIAIANKYLPSIATGGISTN